MNYLRFIWMNKIFEWIFLPHYWMNYWINKVKKWTSPTPTINGPSYLSSPRVSADEALEQTSLRQTWGCWLEGGLHEDEGLDDVEGLGDEGVGAFNLMARQTRLFQQLFFLKWLFPIFDANHVESQLVHWSFQPTFTHIWGDPPEL